MKVYRLETIEIISPTPNEPVYLDPTKKQKLNVKWKKLNKDYNVYLILDSIGVPNVMKLHTQCKWSHKLY